MFRECDCKLHAVFSLRGQSVPAVARLYQHGPALAVCGHAVARKKVLLVSLCAWGGFDMAIDEMGFGYKMYLYSPLSYTRLNIIDAHHTNLYYPSKDESLRPRFSFVLRSPPDACFSPVERRLGYLNKKE